MPIVYDAFISYSHAEDKPVAAALQGAIQRLGKPWYRRRALRIFRDGTSLRRRPSCGRRSSGHSPHRAGSSCSPRRRRPPRAGSARRSTTGSPTSHATPCSSRSRTGRSPGTRTPRTSRAPTGRRCRQTSPAGSITSRNGLTYRLPRTAGTARPAVPRCRCGRRRSGPRHPEGGPSLGGDAPAAPRPRARVVGRGRAAGARRGRGRVMGRGGRPEARCPGAARPRRTGAGGRHEDGEHARDRPRQRVPRPDRHPGRPRAQRAGARRRAPAAVDRFGRGRTRPARERAQRLRPAGPDLARPRQPRGGAVGRAERPRPRAPPQGGRARKPEVGPWPVGRRQQGRRGAAARRTRAGGDHGLSGRAGRHPTPERRSAVRPRLPARPRRDAQPPCRCAGRDRATGGGTRGLP